MGSPAPVAFTRDPTIVQRWTHVTFVHWRYPADVVARLIPSGLIPDVREGSAWVGMVSLRVEGQHFRGLPSVRSRVHATNVWACVCDDSGRPGIWPMSIEIDSLLAVMVSGPASGLPYRWASVTVEGEETPVHSRSRRRRNHELVGHRTSVRRTYPAAGQPLSLERWLTERPLMFSVAEGELSAIRVDHDPWPLHHAQVGTLTENLLMDCGLPAPSGETVAYYSKGVDVRLGSPEPVLAATA